MLSVNLAQAKARLSELMDKVEAGEEIIVTRHGRPAARILPVEKANQPLPFEDLARFRSTMPPQPRPSAELLREMRDEDI